MNFSAQDKVWMQRALDLARQGANTGEVPVGAVLVFNGSLVAESHNQPITRHDPTAHAEVLTLRAAGLRLQNYRLPGTTLYCSLEPCPMCMGAIIHARVERLVFAATDPRSGAAGTVFQLAGDERHNHRIAVSGGLMAEESSQLLKLFFRERR